MRQRNIIIASMVLFFAYTLNCRAEYHWVSIYEHSTSNSCEWVECYGEIYLPIPHPLNESEELYHFLNSGETYKIKIYTGNPIMPNVDSCFAVYNYIAESYEIDGFWTYANTGILENANGDYGIYNIHHSIPVDPEDYPDYSPEELEAIYVMSDLHFHMVTSVIPQYLKIEIQAYRYIIE